MRKKQLYNLLVCKGIEFDEVMNDIAAVAEGSNVGHDKELNDVSVRINKTLIVVLAFVFMLTLSIVYRQLS